MRNDAETFHPIGPKIAREVEQAPEWTPTGTPGIERSKDGKLRNVAPTPKTDSYLDVVYLGSMP